MLLNEQGTVLDRSWRQLRDYDSQASQVLPWLNSAEDRLGREMAQPVKSDPAIIKQQINELKVNNSKRFVLVSAGLALGLPEFCVNVDL